MSGFERSAPVPGSQGPRRSQMVRFNNAPPPLTPWRKEVLEAQRQLAELGKQSSPSRSRSRGKSRQLESSDRKQKASQQSRRPDGGSVVTPEAGIVLRQARGGEGWFAAVARAAENWNGGSATKQSKTAAASSHGEEPASSLKKIPKDQSKSRKLPRDASPNDSQTAETQHRHTLGEVFSERADGRAPSENDDREKRERQRIQPSEASEDRRLRAEQEKKRMEEARQRQEKLKLERQAKLKGAFAVDDDDAGENEASNARQVQRLAEFKRSGRPEVPLGSRLVAPDIGTVAFPSSSAVVQADGVLSERLRFEPGLNPAEAFMRLQERKRKGRRAEFGGPPRGCSPWRDGKKGVSWEE